MSIDRADARRHSSKVLTRRKYLGEPEDPHYVPSSPVISRQSLTYDEEEELTRSCTLVLSGVPHSDDTEEDPLLKYITNQIIIKPKATYQKEKSTSSKPSAGAASDLSGSSQKFARANADTATPSVASKRDTIDRTNTSTPLTILSEVGPRPAASRQNTAAKGELRTTKSQALHVISVKPQPHELRRDNPAASKSAACLTSFETAIEQQLNSATADRVALARMSRVEFNKHLPPLPDVEDNSTARKRAGLSRIFTTGREKQPHVATMVILPQSNDTELRRIQTSSEVTNAKKSKFSFTALFDRRKKRHAAAVATH